jgi:hypothetical protein
LDQEQLNLHRLTGIGLDMVDQLKLHRYKLPKFKPLKVEVS